MCALLEVHVIQSGRYLKYAQLEVRVTVMLNITQSVRSSKVSATRRAPKLKLK